MAVDDPDKVDFIGESPTTGGPMLFIADHLRWDDIHEHLSVLQKKINRYLEFIQSDEFLKRFPAAKEAPAHIEVMCAHVPSPEGLGFLERASEMIAGAGWSLSWRHTPSPLD
jgi:hypothetical protein